MNYVLCNLCGADAWDVRYTGTYDSNRQPEVSAYRCTSAHYGDHPQIVQCRQCGLIYANPRWTPAQVLGAYASVEDSLYLAERVGRELTFHRHLQHMQKFSGPGAGRTLLDVGAYIGVFVEVAQALGWQAYGIEPSRWAVQIAQARGLSVYEGTMDSPLLQGRRFDAITMWDVIEHFDDPAGELRRAFDLLQPGGLIAVHTMDIDSWMARLMGARWPWLMAMHIYYFSPRTLAEMMRLAGFDIVWSGARGRYLRLGYLATRLEGLNRPIGQQAARLFRRLGWSERAVPVNFGDLFTVYGIRPK